MPLLAASITIVALLSALPLAGAGAAAATRIMHTIPIPPNIMLAMVMFPRYLMWKFVRLFHFPELSFRFKYSVSKNPDLHVFIYSEVNSPIDQKIKTGT